MQPMACLNPCVGLRALTPRQQNRRLQEVSILTQAHSVNQCQSGSGTLLHTSLGRLRQTARPLTPRTQELSASPEHLGLVYCKSLLPNERRRSRRVVVGAADGSEVSSSGSSSTNTPVREQSGDSNSSLLAPEKRPENWISPVLLEAEDEEYRSPIQKFLYPDKEELPDDVPMSIWDHLEELRGRVLVSVAFVGAAILLCFCFSKPLVAFLEAPVYSEGVRFLQLSPGEYFFTTLKVAGYCGMLLGGPAILYEVIAFVIPGLTLSERRFLFPIVASSSVLFYAGIAFSYYVLTPAALNFFISYAEGVVESLWSIDQYFEFVLVLMFSTGLAFQVPVIQLLLGTTGLVTAEQMLAVWRYVVVGAVIVAAVLTPSTDPLTQCLLAGPLIGLYMGGAYFVRFVESRK